MDYGLPLLLLLSLLLYGVVVWLQYERLERKLAQKGYRAYLSTRRWKRKAAECKRLAGYRCAVCNSPQQLEAHHRSYQHLYREPQSDLTCLCHSCHELFSQNSRLHKAVVK